MCMYYLNRPGFDYTTGEHVFPAAIGGKRKLPKDYVSKEFNNDISKLEMVVMRNSIVAVARELRVPEAGDGLVTGM